MSYLCISIFLYMSMKLLVFGLCARIGRGSTVLKEGSAHVQSKESLASLLSQVIKRSYKSISNSYHESYVEKEKKKGS